MKLKLLCLLSLMLLAAGALGQTQPATGNISANGVCLPFRTQNNSTVGIIVSGTWTGTLTPNVQIVTTSGAPTVAKKVLPVDGSAAQATITANGGFLANVAGFTQFNVCSTAWTSGTAVVTVYSTPAPNNSTIAGGSGTVAPTCGSAVTTPNSLSTFPSIAFSPALNTSNSSFLIGLTAGFNIPLNPVDSLGNTFQTVGEYTSTSGASLRLGWVPNPWTSSQDTFGIAAPGATFSAGVFLACSGLSPFASVVAVNGVAGGGGVASGVTTFQPGPITTNAGDLVVLTFGSNQAGPYTATADSGFGSFTLVQNSCCETGGLATLVSPGGVINPHITVSSSTSTFSAMIAAFRNPQNSSPRYYSATPIIITVVGATPATGSTVSFAGDGGPAAYALLSWPGEMTVDSVGNLCFPDVNNNRIRCWNTATTTRTIANVSACGGCVVTVAGTGTLGFSGDTGAAISATFGHPVGLAIDGSNNLYIADQQNHRIRKITAATGVVTTVVGSGASENGLCNNGSFTGDGGLATSATLACPQGVALDSAGNIYVADSNNNRIRCVNEQGTSQTLLNVVIAAGNIQTCAGSAGQGGSGDGAAATSATLHVPLGVGLDASGNLYFADFGNNRVRKVATTGTITAFAGQQETVCQETTPTANNGDGGTATAGHLCNPFDVKIDAQGVAYITDSGNAQLAGATIRRVKGGVISTIAGNQALYPSGAFTGDGGPANLAGFAQNFGTFNAPPLGVTPDNLGNLYIADGGNGRIRKLTLPTQ